MKPLAASETAAILGLEPRELSYQRAKDRTRRTHRLPILGPEWLEFNGIHNGVRARFWYDPEIIRRHIVALRERSLVEYRERLNRLTETVRGNR